MAEPSHNGAGNSPRASAGALALDIGAAEADPALTAPSPLREFWNDFSQNRGAVTGLALVIGLVLLATFAGWIAPHSPIEQFRQNALQPPAWQDGGSTQFLLGTDPLGRDILSRLIYGSRLSLFIGFISVTLSLALGVVLGLLAGFLRGFTEIFIMRLMDVMLALPSLLLAIAVVAILGPGLINAMYAIAIVLLPHYVRLTRAAVIGETGREYVAAARIAGAGPLRLMFNTVLPNCTAPLIVQATLGFSTAILDAAALGFLGLGAQPPTPEWGAMLSTGRQNMLGAWWIAAVPGIAILLTSLAFNLFGDGLRDVLDPRSE